MKPIQLILSAFGSYAGKECISFADVQQGIFLITGDTGSGKTTIFDAITYALYDQTSGGKRDGNMMRSQYASQDTETYVSFTFSYRNEIYTIRRNPEYYRTGKRKNADGTLKLVRELAKVELTLPDGSVYIGKKRETDKKIEEIIGLDAGQFTQIAMIAQGDFLKLLHAESKERKIIFSKIFNTKVYWHIQETLKAKTKELCAQLEDNLKESRREIASVECLPDSPYTEHWETLRSLKSPVLDQVLDVLNNILAEGKEREKTALNAVKANQTKADQLNGKLKQAETIHVLFAALETAKTEEVRLLEQSEQFNQLRSNIALLQRCRSVMPYEQQYLEKKKALHHSTEKLQILQNWLDANQTTLQSLQNEYEKQEAIQKKQEAGLQSTLARITDILPQYELLAQYSEQLQSASAQKNILDEKSVELAAALLSQSEELERLHQTLSAQKDCRLELERTQAKSNSLLERKTALRDMQCKISHLQLLRKKQSEGYRQLQDASQLCRKLHNDYETCHDAFFAEQAGILAKNLSDGDPCPVCGSVTHPHKKELTQDAPTQSSVTKAKKNYEKAEKEREEIAGEFQRILQSLEYETAFISTLGRQLVDTGFQPEDHDFAKIPALLFDCEKESKQQIKLLEQCEMRVTQHDQTALLIQKKEKLLDELRLQKESFSRELQTVSIQCKELEASCSLLQKSLPYSSRQEADEALRSAKSALAELKNAVVKARTAYQNASHEMAQKKGEARNEEETRNIAQKTLILSEIQYQKALAEHGFIEEALYLKYKDMLSSLPELEAKLRHYEESCIKAAESIRTLKAQTTGKKPPSLDLLKTELNELMALSKSLQDDYMYLHSLNRKNLDAAKRLITVNQAQGALQSEYMILNNLNQTANGSLSQTVKLDFETYVQRQYFKQIIRAANRRLVQMTSNQFLLQCRDLKDLGTQGQVGLDLDIYNLVTDSTRDVKTLSGGESFLASLCMALGLADIIQNAAGAIRLDTMFIDEGFGSLDDDARAQAIFILNELADQKRLVGIISHVNELKEQIDRKLVVTKSERGSTVRWNY